MDKNRSWPRWIRFGLLSAAAVSISNYIFLWVLPNLLRDLLISEGVLSFAISLIGLGTIGFGFVIVILLGLGSYENALIFILNIGFWFLFGALLGKFINKLGWAALIWLAVFMIMVRIVYMGIGVLL